MGLIKRASRTGVSALHRCVSGPVKWLLRVTSKKVAADHRMQVFPVSPFSPQTRKGASDKVSGDFPRVAVEDGLNGCRLQKTHKGTKPCTNF